MNTSIATQELDTSVCLSLLREAPIGRIAVVVDDRPEIFPINHAVDHGTIVFRTARGTKLAGALGRPVAYEVDGYDGCAWSVVVKGVATEVTVLHDVLDALQLPMIPWEPGSKPHIVRIEPDSITGRRFPIQGVRTPS